MSNSSFGIDSGVVETATAFQSNASPQVASNDWIPPPASLATTDYDGLDLNDEIFLNNQLQPQNRTDSDIPTSPVTMANYGAMQSTWNSPPMQHASPFRIDSNSHYSHRRRFSSAVEQLNRMSIQHPQQYNNYQPTQQGSSHPQSSQENSMFSYRSEPGSISGPPSAASDSHRSSTSSNNNAEAQRRNGVKEELTVNPRELFGSMASAGSMSAPARYILPSSMSSPSLGTIFKGMNGLADEAEPKNTLFASVDTNGSSVMQSPEESFNPMFIMNDECVSAITYWLNNTANIIPDKSNPQSTAKDTRPGWRRNNSIQVIPTSRANEGSRTSSVAGMSSSVGKKKRQKSFNNAIPDIFASELASEHLAGPSASEVPRDLSNSSVDSNAAMSMISPQELASFTQGLESVPGLGQDLMQDVSVSNASKQEPVDLSKYNNSSLPVQDQQLNSSLPGSIERQTSSTNLPQAAKLQSVVNNRGAGADASDLEPKPFPCPECEKQFKRSEHLKRHIRSVHSNIRPFHCKYCEKKFSRSDNLAQHSKTHFKVNSDGSTTIVYGNPNPHNRNRKRSVSMTDDGAMDVGA